MKAFIVAAALAAGLAACGGSSNQTCQNQACPSPSTKSYQICATQGSSVTTETYGGTSCNIDTSNSSDPNSQACATAIANYCTT